MSLCGKCQKILIRKYFGVVYSDSGNSDKPDTYCCARDKASKGTFSTQEAQSHIGAGVGVG